MREVEWPRAAGSCSPTSKFAVGAGRLTMDFGNEDLHESTRVRIEGEEKEEGLESGEEIFLL